jgi:8-oxo-dGTP pyrophosphatase MutT (NUDIX family)
MSDPNVTPFDRLPERFAEGLRSLSDKPVEPRPAATIVLLRDTDVGVEVLLLRRNRSAGFVPGAYVFPGGRVDGSDATEELLTFVDGLTAEAAAKRLGLVDGDPPAIAYYLASVREAFEETGILVGRDTNGDEPATAEENEQVDATRDDLMEDRISFAQVLGQLDCRIDGASCEYLAHWITPKPEPRRYDTRFFAAKVREGATPIVDAREMTDAIWITPVAALARCDEGTLPMVFPTIKMLEQLRGYGTADEMLTSLAGQSVRTIMPTLVITESGVRLELDEDEE